MARKLSKPLTQEDLVYLRQRHPSSYVDRMVDLHGVETAAEPSETDGNQSPDPNEATTVSDVGEGNEGADDLIGVPVFDPQDHTESEIRDHLSDFPEDRERVLELEATGRQRKGVLSL